MVKSEKFSAFTFMDTDAEIKHATDILSDLKSQIEVIVTAEAFRKNIQRTFGLLQNSQRM